MLREIAVGVFVLSVFGISATATAVTWATPTVTDGKANITSGLKENDASGSAIITLASDGDTYSIGEQTDMFTVADNGTLILVNNASLDFETTSSYTLTVTAGKTDKSLTSTDAILTIYVEDVNDNAPAFEQKEYRKTIQNNTAKDTGIIQVTATDGDKSDTFNTVTYKISDGNGAGLFDISTSNGTIVAQKDILVPSVITYNLTVQADDNGKGADQMHGKTTVKICVGCSDSGTGQPGVALSLMSLALLLALQH